MELVSILTVRTVGLLMTNISHALKPIDVPVSLFRNIVTWNEQVFLPVKQYENI